VLVPGRDDADQYFILAQGKSDVDAPPFVGLAQSVKARLFLAARGIFQKQQGFVEENALRFRHRYAILFVHSGIPLGPV